MTDTSATPDTSTGGPARPLDPSRVLDALESLEPAWNLIIRERDDRARTVRVELGRDGVYVGVESTGDELSLYTEWSEKLVDEQSLPGVRRFCDEHNATTAVHPLVIGELVEVQLASSPTPIEGYPVYAMWSTELPDGVTTAQLRELLDTALREILGALRALDSAFPRAPHAAFRTALRKHEKWVYGGAPPWSLGEAISPYRRVTELGSRDSPGMYWRAMLLGLLPGALVIAGLAWAASAAPGSFAWVPALVGGLLGLWWLAAVVAATRRRLLDAGADPHLALAWPALPFASASGLLALAIVGSIVPIPPAAHSPLILGVGIGVPAVLLALALVAAATPTRRWPLGERPVMLIASIVLMPIVAGLAVLVWKIIRGVVRPNLGTRLLLLACAIGLLVVSSQYALDPVLRVALAVLIGLVYAGVHVLRWRMQVRHFRSAVIEVHYLSRDNRETRDPRYRPVLFGVFKAFGLGAIILSTVAATHPPTPPTVAIIVAAFLASTGYLAIFGFVGVIVAMLPWTPPVEGPLTSIAVPYLIAYILVACLFGLRWLLATPTDNRFNFTSAFRQYARASEW